MSIIYYSPYALGADNASSVRLGYFFKELKKNHDVKIIFPWLPPVRNNRPMWWRVIREVGAGVELSVRLMFSPTRLVILSSPPYLTILMAALAMSVVGRKFILDIRDPYPEVLFELKIFSPSSFLGRFLKSLTKFVFSRSVGVVSTTHGIEEIIRSYQANSHTKVVFNGFDPELFSPKALSEKFEKFTLIFHGNLARMQNIDLLIQVARGCPEDIDILVAGAGPLEDSIKKEKRIRFLGSLSHREVAKTVNRCHVGLSFRNNGFVNRVSFPVRVLEYMGAGLPVISTPRSDVGNLLEEQDLGYQFENTEVERIVNQILHLKEHYRATQPYYKFSRVTQARIFAQFIEQSLSR